MNKFKVLQSNEKETEPGSFITKVQTSKEVEDALMGKKMVKRTYYFKGSIQHTVGAELPIDLSNYNVQAHPAKNPETGEDIMLNWLHLKA